MRFPNIELVAIDIDGTLLDSRSCLQPCTMRSVQRIRAMGIQVVLASGRPAGSVAEVADRLGGNMPVIAYNGAYTSIGGEPWDARPMDADRARRLLGWLEQKNYYVKLYADTRLYVGKATEETRSFSAAFGIPYVEVGAKRLADAGLAPLKIVVLDDNPRRIEGIYQDSWRWEKDFAFVHDSDRGVEIVSQGVSKGAALAKICRSFGIQARRVMAFGNEANDVEMIQYAGFGVAMANSYPGLLRHAGIVADSNDDFGVARVLDKICRISWLERGGTE